MFTISFKDRIALYYSITTAVLILVVFTVIFFVVKAGVYNSVDHDLQKELDDLFGEITVNPEGFSIGREEWYEKEHNTLGINPIFIQFTDTSGNAFNRSPNLKNLYLQYRGQVEGITYDNNLLGEAPVRQANAPVRYRGRIVGYILVAAPLKEAQAVVSGLQDALFIAYPLLLAALFSIARLLAGSSIRPVQAIISTAAAISRSNLTGRIAAPKHKDELFELATTINHLLDRIERAMMREKQFTADASHELRTPLAVIRGNLEVLVRKPRTQLEYEERIRYCIDGLDRMNSLVDQLLLLARFESHKEALNIERITINALVLDAVSRYAHAMANKEINVQSTIDNSLQCDTDPYFLSIVLDNLVSNAVKYSRQHGLISISAKYCEGFVELEISDNGIGIIEEDRDRVFASFYRSAHKQSTVEGSGLGLSIAKRICELLQVNITLQSQPGRGTVVTLAIPEKWRD